MGFTNKPKRIDLALLLGGILIYALAWGIPAGAQTARDPIYKNEMLIEAVPGQNLGDYESVPKAPGLFKPKVNDYKKVRYRLEMGDWVKTHEPALYWKRVDNMATFCVSYERLPDADISFVGGSRSEITWVYDPNEYGQTYGFSSEMAEQRNDRLNEYCENFKRFGDRHWGWDDYPESIIVPFEGRRRLIPGYLAARRPDYQELLHDNDLWCVNVLDGYRSRTDGRTAGNNSNYVLALMIAPEMNLSGRGSMPIGFNDELYEGERDRCEDYQRKRRQMRNN